MRKSDIKSLALAFIAFVAFAFTLSILRFIISGNFDLWFLIWNLFLATVPMFFAWAFLKSTKQQVSFNFKNILLLVLWLLFLPNAFYIITDFIHLANSDPDLIVYDAVLVTAYTVAGLILGYASLGLIHYSLAKRNKKMSLYFVFLALFLSGYAIYLGRFLRWNSWDVLLNPFAIIFDISRSLLSFSSFIEAFGTSLLFFGFLSLLYVFLWRLIIYIRNFK